MARQMYLIDEPASYSLKEWQEHLRELREIPDQDALGVQESIRRALEQIRLISRFLPGGPG